MLHRDRTSSFPRVCRTNLLARFTISAAKPKTPSEEDVETTGLGETKPALGLQPAPVQPQSIVLPEPQIALPQGPYKIGLIDVGGKLPIDIHKLVKRLNGFGGNFHYGAGEKVSILGKFDLTHGYSDNHFWGFVREHIHGTEYAYGIGLTHLPLVEKDAFNRHDIVNGVGMITFHDYRKYTPINRDLEQYLVYLILCESFCLVGETQFEHNETECCLFDMCGNKDDLRPCLSNPQIVQGTNRCRTRLRRAGFSEQDLEAAQRMLRFVGRLKFRRLIDSLMTPTTTLLLGALLTEIAAVYMSKLPEVWSQVFDFAIVLCLVVSLAYSCIRAGRAPQY